MCDSDDLSNDAIEQRNRKNVADKAAVLIVRESLPREVAIDKVNEYINDIDEAYKEAEKRDGTDEAYEAYLTKPSIDFESLTETQRKQVFVISKELIDQELV
jgi:hypothetical protein